VLTIDLSKKTADSINPSSKKIALISISGYSLETRGKQSLHDITPHEQRITALSTK